MPPDHETDFNDLRLRLECGEISLVQNCERPLILKGPGEIWQDRSGRLEFKIYLPQSGYAALRSHSLKPRTSGQILADAEYFSLTACAFDGAIWEADRVLPSWRGSFGGLAHGFVDRLTKEREVPVSHPSLSLTLRFFEFLKFPVNTPTEVVTSVAGQKAKTSWSLDTADVECPPYRIRFQHDEGHTTAVVNAPLLTDLLFIASRIQEALQFAFAQPMTLLSIRYASGKTEGISLLSTDRAARGSEFLRPLRSRTLDEGGDFWRLFGAYLKYVVTDTSDSWHAISIPIGSVMTAAAAPFETQALVLSVAVETVIGMSGSGTKDAPPKEELAAAEKALQDAELSQSTRNRILGSIRSIFGRPRNTDRLRSFIESKGLDTGLYDSWSALRNSAAHGSDLRKRTFEDCLRLRDEVTTLFYSIIFDMIDYEGSRIDYSTLGWPDAHWPIRRDTDESSKTSGIEN